MSEVAELIQEVNELYEYTNEELLIKDKYYKFYENEILCSICKKLNIFPMFCQFCQCTICEHCYSKSNYCPNEECYSKFKPSIIVKKLILKLSFRCKNCQKIIKYNDLQSHYTSKCPKIDYEAKYQNNLEIMKKLKTEISKYESFDKNAILFRKK